MNVAADLNLGQAVERESYGTITYGYRSVHDLDVAFLNKDLPSLDTQSFDLFLGYGAALNQLFDLTFGRVYARE